MSRPLRIVVADDEDFMLNYYREVLPALGHEVVAMARSGRELLEESRAARPDLVITDIKMPGLDGLDAAGTIADELQTAVVLVSAYADDDFIRRAEDNHVMAFLVKPIKQQDLAPAIALAIRRSEQFQALRKEAADLRQALEDRKVIERAKGVLMKKGSLDEQEAFRRLQKLSRDNNKKLVEVARAILLAEEALQVS